MKDIHKGFTIAELVTAMVVIALVVGITLPITINKMNKVDAVSYYLGYKTMIEISANVDLSGGGGELSRYTVLSYTFNL